ncbi:MAG: helix-turn-helix domain-containing protein [Gammaproteobacteria bacterium]|nr:helix-turn-helix domain-containing protein [Gammaproteobacteria bacterium]
MFTPGHLSSQHDPEVFSAIPSFHTSDIDVAIERITRMFGPHRIELADQGNEINFEHSFAWLADVCINQFAYGRELRDSVDHFDDENYCVILPMGGKYSIETAGKRVEASSDSIAIVNPDCPVTLELSSDYRNVAVRISKNALDNALVNHIGERPNEAVQFIPHPQALNDGTEPLRNLALQVWQECQSNSSLISYAAVGRELGVLLASMLLLRIPNNYSDKLAKVDEIKPTSAVETAAKFLRKNAREDININDVLKVSKLAKTSLYAEFGKFYAMTPMEYLHRERLKLAYNALASASSDSICVTNVALDCGFMHFSRFAGYYKKQFGELPSETLQRNHVKFSNCYSEKKL